MSDWSGTNTGLAAGSVRFWHDQPHYSSEKPMEGEVVQPDDCIGCTAPRRHRFAIPNRFADRQFFVTRQECTEIESALRIPWRESHSRPPRAVLRARFASTL